MGTDRKMVDSGVEWIGEVPSEWRVEKLSGLVQETSNKNRDMKENNLLSLSYGRIVRKDIESNQGLLPQSFEGYNIVSPGDVVLRLTDLQNDQRSLRTALVTERGIITSAYTTISAPAMEAKYFAYAMNACDSSKVFYRLGGGVRQSMRFQDIKQILIPIPDSFEQQSIANYLDHHVGLIDEERELISQKIGLLKDKRSALIFEVVTGKRTLVEAQHLAGVDDWSDIVGSGELRAVPTPRADDPFAKSGRLVDSGVEWIGEMPEGWEVRQLKSLLSKNSGGAWGEEAKGAGDTMVLRSTEQSVDGEWIIENPEWRHLSASDIIKTRMIPGDILITKSSGSPTHIGKATLVDENNGNGAGYSNFMQRLRVKSYASSKYVWRVLMSEVAKEQFNLMSSTTTGLANLNGGIIGSILIPLPPLPTQKSIADFLDLETGLIDKEIDLLSRKSELLSEQRKALIFEAVTGKIEITE